MRRPGLMVVALVAACGKAAPPAPSPIDQLRAQVGTATGDELERVVDLLLAAPEAPAADVRLAAHAFRKDRNQAAELGALRRLIAQEIAQPAEQVRAADLVLDLHDGVPADRQIADDARAWVAAALLDQDGCRERGVQVSLHRGSSTEVAVIDAALAHCRRDHERGQWFERRYQLDPPDAQPARFEHACSAVAFGQATLAPSCLREAADDPQRAQDWRVQVARAAMTEVVAERAALLRAAVRLAPQGAHVHLSLAATEHQLGNRGAACEALTAARKAAETFGDLPEATDGRYDALDAQYGCR